MFTTCSIINKPTTINAGAVAKEGITLMIGEKISATRKSMPTIVDVRPVLPPSVTPEALSTKVVTVDVPSTAPTVVPIAEVCLLCQDNLPL